MIQLAEFVDDQILRAALAAARVIAVVGAKDKPGQPVDGVGRYLIAAGYRVIPVHPVRKEVWGLPTFRTLAEIPEPIDIVDVFRAPDYCEAHAREALELQWPPAVFWMQTGIRNEQVYSLVRRHEREHHRTPMLIVQDACIKTEHQRLLSTAL